MSLWRYEDWKIENTVEIRICHSYSFKNVEDMAKEIKTGTQNDFWLL